VRRLGINIDNIVALREFGGGHLPDPVHAITMIEMAGADSIVYTLNDAATEAQTRDLKILRDCIHSHFNLRLAPSTENIQRAVQAKAEMVTFIQHEAAQIGSVNITQNENHWTSLIGSLRSAGIVVNALIDPDAQQIKSALKAGFDYIELNAGRFVASESLTRMEQELENLKAVSMAASKLNLGVTVSGKLNYTSVREILKIDAIEEINIGHAVIARSLFVGFDQAVRDLISIIK
jgi:pyridoxine 5-phosphate synthase